MFLTVADLIYDIYRNTFSQLEACGPNAAL